MNKNILIVVVLIIVIGGFASWHFWLKNLVTVIPSFDENNLRGEEVKEIPAEEAWNEEAPIEVSPSIGPSAVWDLWTPRPWQECEGELDCIFAVMLEGEASPDAMNFVKLLSDNGFLGNFQEMGRIDLGLVLFPSRANNNEALYLLNGQPPLISTEIYETEELMSEMKQHYLYSEMEKRHSDIWFVGSRPSFVEKRDIPDGGERFVFAYRFVDGCRSCHTEYFTEIGFDFNLGGEFLKTSFLQIRKFDLPGMKPHEFIPDF